MDHENLPMKVRQLELSPAHLVHSKDQLGIINGEIDSENIEGRHLPSSYVCFVWELHDQV